MKRYRVWGWKETVGYIDVEAENEHEAWEIVNSTARPSDFTDAFDAYSNGDVYIDLGNACNWDVFAESIGVEQIDEYGNEIEYDPDYADYDEDDYDDEE